MRKIYAGAHTFTPANKTIQFAADITSLKQIFVIINLTKQVMIYNFADASIGGSFLTDTLTLAYDTTLHGAGDLLQVFYEPIGTDATIPTADSAIASLLATSNALLTSIDTMGESLQELCSRLSFLSGLRGTASDLRVALVTTAVTQPISGTVTPALVATATTPMAAVPTSTNNQSELVYIGNINRCSAV